MEECWSVIFLETSPLSCLISNGMRTQILKLIKHMGKAYVPMDQESKVLLGLECEINQLNHESLYHVHMQCLTSMRCWRWMLRLEQSQRDFVFATTTNTAWVRMAARKTTSSKFRKTMHILYSISLCPKNTRCSMIQKMYQKPHVMGL